MEAAAQSRCPGLPKRGKSSALEGLLVLGALTLALLGAGAFVLPQGSRAAPRRAPAVQLQAEGMCVGNCLQPDGSWKPTGEIAIQGPEEDAMAQESWEAFKTQYESASERGMYMDTPVGEDDIKYRWRRLRDTFGVTSAEALEIIKTEALPLVIDSNYVQETFDAMVEGSSREKALEIVGRHPGILAAGKAVKDNMLQAEVASTFINGFRGFGSLFR
eukprot:TRINITY_DN1412_c0_g1_i1.p1 TRINITY_DN1412_c0_g1~~TRINITY_DN1412_c0_g1_i1.p1  ORF type:complete len:236 (+),score=72.30 TRINITY_DN1412_c0_g1_i1:59-709(+)